PNPAFILPTSSKALASSGAYARPASAPQPSSATPEGKQKKGPRWVDVETGHQSEEEDPQESHQETEHEKATYLTRSEKWKRGDFVKVLLPQ
ncbi:unnamed protein product, partial [Allacma fusca]